MNTRDYKQFSKGEYYHVFNRGVGKADIFKDERDYQNFLKRLRLALGFKVKSPRVPLGPQGESLIVRGLRIKSFPRDAFSVVCYCLMPNHFHLLIRQNTDIPVSSLLSKVCTSYSMYFNRKYNRVGNLFQDIFKSINIDKNEYLLWLSAYIHQNPPVAGLVWDINQWKWSSYGNYVGEGDDELCDKAIILEQFKTNNAYLKYVETSFDEIKRKKEISPIFLD